MRISISKTLRKKFWIAGAIAFIIWIIAIFIFSASSLILTTLPWVIIGSTLFIDGLYAFKEKVFVLMAYTIRGPMAQVGASVIMLVGFFMAVGNLATLFGL